jgi:hypothetical protein
MVLLLTVSDVNRVATLKDDDAEDEDYDRTTHPVWEYDAGGRGHKRWQRYPNK